MEAEAQLFKSLAEPVRLRIMTLLLSGERCVCDLMAVLNMPQSTVSRHLANLKNAGLVCGRRQGVWMYYQLAEPESDLHAGLLDLLHTIVQGSKQSASDMKALKQHIALKNQTK